MSLSPGTRFGVYEVRSPIGAGGMGEVYLAHDTRLGRDVALKVLPEAFAQDPDRLARFRREAQLLAALNDSGIAQIYGVEERDGKTAIAMEYVGGQTLAARIAQSPLPPDEALSIARKLALALEAAHRQGITHRDLKPANIKIRDDGAVKVLDFGLAKGAGPAVSTDAGDAPTITSPALTVEGVILGTAAYMAPEQARGRAVDERVDIWAFGCVFYEMLAGRRPFEGADVSELIAAILKSDPDWSRLPDLPPVVAAFLRRCLAKDPADRVHDIADVRLALEGAFDGASEPVPAASAPAAWRPAVVAAVAGMLAASLLAWSLWPRIEPRVTRLEFEAFDANRTYTQMMSVAPDGRAIVFCTPEALQVRPIDQLDVRAIPGTPMSTNPVFSPDGRAVAYWSTSSRELKKTGINGGATMVIARVDYDPWGVSWTDDDMIVYGQRDGVWEVPAAGGDPTLILALDGEVFFGPQILPDDDSILLTVTDAPDWSRPTVVAVSRTTRQRTVLVSEGRGARYLSTGHLVYGVGDVLYAAPFSLRSLATTGQAVPLARGLHASNGVTHYAVSSDGTLAYMVAREPGIALVWVDRQGRETPAGVPPGAYRYVRISPDGRRLAIDEGNDANDIWIWNIDDGTQTRLAVGDAGGWYPVWNLEGRHVAYGVSGSGVWRRSIDNIGDPEALVDVPRGGIAGSPYQFLPDGSLLFRVQGEIWLRPTGAEPVKLIDESTAEREVSVLNAHLSPNGRWLAYQSNESGEFQVHVRPFPNVSGGRLPVSTAGGVTPRWSSDNELLYVEPEGRSLGPGTMIAVTMDAGAVEPVIRSRTRLFQFPTSFTIIRTWDLAADGRFLITKATGPPATMVVVQDWFEELRDIR